VKAAANKRLIFHRRKNLVENFGLVCQENKKSLVKSVVIIISADKRGEEAITN
jgi:hypothetical protein